MPFGISVFGEAAMLRQWRSEGQSMVIRLNNSRKPEDQITVKVCTIDSVTGRAQIGVSASNDHNIFREEAPDATGYRYE